MNRTMEFVRKQRVWTQQKLDGVLTTNAGSAENRLRKQYGESRFGISGFRGTFETAGESKEFRFKVFAGTWIIKQHQRFACAWRPHSVQCSWDLKRNLTGLVPESNTEKVIFWSCIENPVVEEGEDRFLMVVAISSS